MDFIPICFGLLYLYVGSTLPRFEEPIRIQSCGAFAVDKYGFVDLLDVEVVN